MVHYVLFLLRSEAETIILCKIIAELPGAATKRSPITIETEPHARIQIENHRTIFSWSTWLVVWIVVLAPNDANDAEHGGHTPANSKSCSLDLIKHNL